jgi:hypothetical protein
VILNKIRCYRGEKDLNKGQMFMKEDGLGCKFKGSVTFSSQFSLLANINFLAMFSILCYVEADISHINFPPRLSPHKSAVYYKADYDVIFSFGLTELKACLSWKENVSPIFAHQDVGTQ